MTDTFTLRPMQPTDSAALSDLYTDLTGFMTTYFQTDTFTVMTASDEHETKGVVIDSGEPGKLAGSAVISFGEMQFNGQVLPYALLASLHVLPDFRKRGLGRQLAEWRVNKAREQFGDDGVIITGLQTSNDASRATAAKWSREFLEPIHAAPIGIRTKPPRNKAGVTVREVEVSELEEAIRKQNTFYADYNFYEPLSVDRLSKIMEQAVNGQKANHYLVVVSPSGELLAGVRVRRRGLYMQDTINNPPLPMRLMNKILNFAPQDYIIREVQGLNIWHVPGQLKAAQHLWQMMRWMARDWGTSIFVSYDERSPLPQIYQLKPWNFPRFKIAFALHGPAPLDRSRLHVPSGRR